MRIPKVYGQSKDETCFFCKGMATTQNKQGFATCVKDKDKLMDDKQCACGRWMEVKKSKWGPFFLCNSCGVQSLNKVLNAEKEGTSGGYKLNKSFRKKEPVNYTPGRIYTIEELEKMWD